MFQPEELHKTGGTKKDMYVVVNYGLTSRSGSYSTYLKFNHSSERVNPVDLSLLTRNYTAQDGDILTGKAPANVGITISPGATVTLSDANITQIPNDTDHKYAGITCPGNATLILSGDNAVKGGHSYYPGVYIAQGFTLTIKGTGSLAVQSNNGFGAGIGAGVDRHCGNITIDSGTINIPTMRQGTAIGAATRASCGNITINSGNITVSGGTGSAGSGTTGSTGGENSPGLGTGAAGRCGDITIANTVTRVTAA